MLVEFRNVYKDFNGCFIMVAEKGHVNKFLILGVLGLFLISFMGSFVVAEDAEEVGQIIGETAGEFGKGVRGFFEGLFGDTLLGNGALGKIFMALLIGMFVYAALSTFFDKATQGWILNTATVAATGLAILGLPENFLESILTGYGAMGAAILMIIPFFIIFWFTVKVKSVLMARGIWLFYTTYYFGFYIQELIQAYASGGSSQMLWPSFIALVLGGIMFFFILGVRGFIFKGEMEEVVEKGTQKAEERKHRLETEMKRLKADE